RPGTVAGLSDALWPLLWANVVAEREAVTVDARLFPWLAPTRISDKGQTTTPAEMQPQQAYWGMPRRLRLVWTANEAGL
ncbi:type I-E CRISPR-associated protein Cse1/CasA, partial [Acinetobacter baumannii]